MNQDATRNWAAAARTRGGWAWRMAVLWCIVTAVAGVAASPEREDDPAGFLGQGLERARAGDSREALRLLGRALEDARTSRAPELEISSALAMADIHQGHGQLCLAREVLERAVPVAELSGNAELRCRVHAELGNTLYLSRRFELASRWLRSALALARAVPDTLQEARILEGLGNLAMVGDDALFRGSGETVPGAMPAEDPAPGEHTPLETALVLYGMSESLAETAGAKARIASVRVNRARAFLRAGRFSEAESACRQAAYSVQELPEDRLRTFLLVACGRVFAQLHEAVREEGGGLLRSAFGAYREALERAANAGSDPVQTYALGFLAELYLKQGRHEDAGVLTERAMYFARSRGDDVAAVQWAWQQGRILAAQGRREEAIDVYRQAAESLTRVRSDAFIGSALLGGRKPFRESFGRIYLELADLLLSGVLVNSASESEARLREARAAVEMLKLIEVEDYYLEDDCADLLRVRSKELDVAADSRAAILYCIVLGDRTELLLNLPSGMRRYRSGVGEARLRDTAERFRRQLELRNPIDSLPLAQELWAWLVAPLANDLEAGGITTLVFVPDGVLRTIPLAALHDGQRYLVERFAVAVSPGLSLMQPRSMPRSNLRVLLCGISEGVDDFRPLQSVAAELAGIHEMVGGQTLLNDGFRTAAFARELQRRPATIVHLATHAEFGSDANRSFVLAYDRKMTLDELERLLLPQMLDDHPIELLALSACETAAGNEQAALGLAAIAVKAGARSALATLWPIDDEAAQRVMCGFYRSLMQDGTATRAECLRRAQLELMTDRRLRSPSFWSPVVLIGNWL